MRSPKIEALHRLIDWFNIRNEEQIPKLGLDISPLKDNAWLSGFIEADGNFNSDFTIDNRDYAIYMKYYIRLTQRQSYPTQSSVNPSIYQSNYLSLMSEIAKFLDVNKVTSINRPHKLYIELGYEVRTVKVSSHVVAAIELALC